MFTPRIGKPGSCQTLLFWLILLWTLKTTAEMLDTAVSMPRPTMLPNFFKFAVVCYIVQNSNLPIFISEVTFLLNCLISFHKGVAYFQLALNLLSLQF